LTAQTDSGQIAGLYMFKRFTEKYIRFSLRYWVLVILLSGVVVVPAFKGTIRMFKNIDTDLANLLPEFYPSVEMIYKVRDKLAGSGNLWVILEGPNRETVLPFLDDLVDELAQHTMIYDVEFRKPAYDFFDKHKLLYVSLEDLKDIRERIDRKIQREKLGGFYISFEDEEDQPKTFDEMLDKYKGEYSSGIRSPYYESDDGQVFLINVKPEGTASDFKFSEKFYKSVSRMVEEFRPESRHESIKVYYAGSIRSRVDEYKSLMSDLMKAGYVAGIGILLLLMLVFRGVRPILMVLIPLCVGIIYTFGITSLFIDGFNTVTGFMFAIMMGLGIDFGVHMVSRYLEERSHGREVAESLFHVLYNVGKASWTSAVTTATAFFLLLIVDFKGFSEFGFIAGIGILCSFFTYWLLLPAWIRFLELFRPIRRAPVPFLKFLERYQTFPRPKTVFGITAGLTLLSLLLLPKVGFEYDYGKLRANLPKAEKARSMEQRVRQRRPNPAVVFLNSQEESEAIEEAIDKVKLEEGSLIDRFASMYSLVPKQQGEKSVVMGEIDELLADDIIEKLIKDEDRADIDDFRASLDVPEIELADIPDEVMDKFTGDKSIPGTVGLIVPRAGIELHDGKKAIQWAAEVQEIETELGTVQSSSDAIIFANVLSVMLEETRVAIPLAFLGVLLFLILDFRKLKKVLAVVVPWISGVLWMSACIVLFDLKLNFYNVFIPAAVFGMGIDYSVHLFHRYMENTSDVPAAVASAGRAIIIAGLTTIIGFSGLAMANHRGLQSMGLLAIMGITSCMICSLTMLPAALEMWRKK
jgi:predicted RND superfamily exporter protein